MPRSWPPSSERTEELRNEPSLAGRFRRIEALTSEELDKLITLRVSAGSSAVDLAAQFVSAKTTMDVLRAELDAVVQNETVLLDERLAEVDRLGDWAMIALVVGLVVGLVGGLVASVVFMQSIAGRIAILRDNARRLEEGAPLRELPPGDDEIGELGHAASCRPAGCSPAGPRRPCRPPA